jgi:hypothetical protein
MPTSLAYAAAVVPTKYRPLHRPAKTSELMNKFKRDIKADFIIQGNICDHTHSKKANIKRHLACKGIKNT